MDDRRIPDRRIAQVLREIRVREADRAYAAREEELERRDENRDAWYASRVRRSWAQPAAGFEW